MEPTLANVFDGSLDIISWADDLNGFHAIYYNEPTSGFELLSIPYAEIRAYHSRLLDVFDVLKSPVGNPVSSYVANQTDIILTISSEWRYRNHQVDYSENGNCETYCDWKLDKVLKIRSHDTESNHVRVRLQIYQTDLLPDGLSYVSKNKTLNIVRPLTWLDQHYQDGSATFLRAEELGLPMDEIGTLLQQRYLPQNRGANLPLPLPDGTDNFF